MHGALFLDFISFHLVVILVRKWKPRTEPKGLQYQSYEQPLIIWSYQGFKFRSKPAEIFDLYRSKICSVSL